MEPTEHRLHERVWQPTVMGEQCRLGSHERIGPAFDDPALSINGQVCLLSIEGDLDELAFAPLADLEGLTE